jgi:hypothetical protein
MVLTAVANVARGRRNHAVTGRVLRRGSWSCWGRGLATSEAALISLVPIRRCLLLNLNFSLTFAELGFGPARKGMLA